MSGNELDTTRPDLESSRAMSDERLSVDTETPDVVRIRRCLQVLGVHDLHVHAFESLPSTNTFLRELAQESTQLPTDQQVRQSIAPPDGMKDTHHADGIPDGTQDTHAGNVGDRPHLCIADWQSAGAGRRGHAWQSRPGNLMFSILDLSTRSSRALMGLSLVSGIALAECLIQSTGLPVRLKWPNDLMLDSAKLGGLTTELFATRSTEGAEATRILTGVGINLLDDPNIVPAGYPATSLQASGVSPLRRDRDELAARLVARVLEAHAQFDAEGWSGFSGRWSALDWLRGRQVTIRHDKGVEHAVADGVNEEGALMVSQEGSLRPVYSGDVSVRPDE